MLTNKQKAHRKKRLRQRARATRRPLAPAVNVMTGEAETSLILSPPPLHRFSTAAIIAELEQRDDLPSPLALAIDQGTF